MEVNKMNRLLKLKSRVINLPAKLLLERFPLLSWVTENLILTSYFTKKIVLNICFYDFIMILGKQNI